MIFAFWDPAVLGTILGQEADETLHVPGPVFTERQRAALLRDIRCWWYWDREGGGQRVLGKSGDALQSALPKAPLKLVQVQVDILVEASVPDQLLALLAQNSPLLLRRIDQAVRYGWVRQHLLEGRKLGLHSMLDLVNYLSACLIYGDELYKRPITALLDRVKSKEISFDEALAGMMELETP